MADTRTRLVERLFTEHGRALQAFLFRRVSRQSDAADLAQEVYLRMLRVADIESIRSPESYLLTVASNLVKEHGRRGNWEARAVDVLDPLIQDQLTTLPAFGGNLDQEQRVERLRLVLQQLSPKCRAVVILQYWHHQSYREIAQQLGISTNMVKKYLSQALVHCRKKMARLV